MVWTDGAQGSPFALAVDIGATKAALGIVSETYEVLAKTEVSTGRASGIWESIAEASKRLLDQADGQLVGVGIASAGPLDLPAGTISPVNIPSWREFPVVGRFLELTGASRLVLRGDAVALAQAEHVLGAGRGASSMLGMVVSTGIGGGLVLEGRLINGVTGNAGFFGHHSIHEHGRLCVCGREGCVEAYASGPSMVAIAREMGWQGPESFENLAAAAVQGDQIAALAIDLGAHSVAVGIVNVLAIMDINLVVVGGGVSQAGDVYWQPLRRHVVKEAQFAGFIKDVDLRPASLNRDAGLIGAALAVFKEG